MSWNLFVFYSKLYSVVLIYLFIFIFYTELFIELYLTVILTPLTYMLQRTISSCTSDYFNIYIYILYQVVRRILFKSYFSTLTYMLQRTVSSAHEFISIYLFISSITNYIEPTKQLDRWLVWTKEREVSIDINTWTKLNLSPESE